MKENILNVYLDEIGQGTLLAEADEQRLSARVLEGDERALNRLIEANLRLVVSTARQYQGQGLPMDDLVSEGNIGLMRAARKYDARRGLRFAGYAVPFVRQQIEKALHRESDQQRLEASPAGSSRSVDAPLGTKTGLSLLSVLADGNVPATDERVYNAAVLSAVDYALSALEARERRVVNAYFGIGQDHLTMAEIAADMGLKRERVRQIRDRAVRRLKKSFKSRLSELRP